MIWQPTNDAAIFSETDDMFKIEMLHLTTILVQYYPDLLDDARKDIMKHTWLHISSSDDVIVKQTAVVLKGEFMNPQLVLCISFFFGSFCTQKELLSGMNPLWSRDNPRWLLLRAPPPLGERVDLRDGRCRIKRDAWIKLLGSGHLRRSGAIFKAPAVGPKLLRAGAGPSGRWGGAGYPHLAIFLRT